MSSPDSLKLARAAALSALLLLASGQALAQAPEDDEDEDAYKGRPTTLSFGAFGDSEKSFSFDGALTLPLRERFTVDAGIFYNRAEGDPTEVALSTVGGVAGVTYQLFDRWDVGGSVRWFGRGGQVRTAEGALKAGFAPTEAWHFSAGGLYRNTTLTVNIDLPLPFNDIKGDCGVKAYGGNLGGSWQGERFGAYADVLYMSYQDTLCTIGTRTFDPFATRPGGGLRFPVLSRLIGSRVTRATSFLENSIVVGVDVPWRRVVLNFEGSFDKDAFSGDPAKTFSVGMRFSPNELDGLQLRLGATDSQAFGQAYFAGAQVSFGW